MTLQRSLDPSTTDATPFAGLIGLSRNFRAALEDVKTVAETDCTVLVQGETGTGKEGIAQAIHQLSPRRRQRFVVVNCAAIPAALLEAELFGHSRGAFTGAVTSRIGRFQAADEGTLFLDEIGELPLELQAKLLRAIQEQEIDPIGSSHPTRINVRIVAATNQELFGMVSARRFRPDLYYRLNVFPVTLPPLRDRRGDVRLLAAHFVRMFADRHRRSISDIPDDVMQALEAHEWPGNVRELQNFIERSVILTNGSELRAPIAELAKRRLPNTSVTTLDDAARLHILATLLHTDGIVGGRNGAAARLGLKRTTLIARMKKLGLSNVASQR